MKEWIKFGLVVIVGTIIWWYIWFYLPQHTKITMNPDVPLLESKCQQFADRSVQLLKVPKEGEFQVWENQYLVCMEMGNFGA